MSIDYYKCFINVLYYVNNIFVVKFYSTQYFFNDYKYNFTFVLVGNVKNVKLIAKVLFIHKFDAICIDTHKVSVAK